MNWRHIVTDNRTNDIIRAIPKAGTVMVSVPNNGGDCRGVGGDKRVFSDGRVGSGGGTSFSGSPDTWNNETFSTSERAPNHSTSISIAEDICHHIGSLGIEGTFASGIFPFFNDITRRVFDFKNVGEWLIDTTTGERSVGVGVFNWANVTARADGDRETTRSISTIRKITKVMSNFQAVFNAIDIKCLNGWNIKGVSECLTNWNIAIEGT